MISYFVKLIASVCLIYVIYDKFRVHEVFKIQWINTLGIDILMSLADTLFLNNEK